MAGRSRRRPLQILRYSRKMNTLELNGHQWQMPSDWSELSAAQIRKLATVLLSEEMRALGNTPKNQPLEDLLRAADYYALRIKVLMVLLNPRWKWRLAWYIRYRLRPEHYAQILDSTDTPVDWAFKVKLVENRFPVVRVGLKKYHGPGRYLQGIEFWEYQFAMQRYSTYMKKRDRKSLQKFFCILYRAERKDVPRNSAEYAADSREEFIDTRSDALAARFDRAPETVMLAAVLLWQGCLRQLEADYPFVFNRKKKKGGGGNPAELIMSLAGSSKKSDVAEQAKAPVHNVLTDLNRRNRESETQMEELKRKRRK